MSVFLRHLSVFKIVLKNQHFISFFPSVFSKFHWFFSSLILITSFLLFALVLFSSAVAWDGCLGYWFEDFFFTFLIQALNSINFPHGTVVVYYVLITFHSVLIISLFNTVCVTHRLFRSMLLNFTVFGVFCAFFLFFISFVLHLIWLFKFVVVCFMIQDIVYLECSVRLLEKNVYPTVIGWSLYICVPDPLHW